MQENVLVCIVRIENVAKPLVELAVARFLTVRGHR